MNRHPKIADGWGHCCIKGAAGRPHGAEFDKTISFWTSNEEPAFIIHSKKQVMPEDCTASEMPAMCCQKIAQHQKCQLCAARRLHSIRNASYELRQMKLDQQKNLDIT